MMENIFVGVKGEIIKKVLYTRFHCINVHVSHAPTCGISICGKRYKCDSVGNNGTTRNYSFYHGKRFYGG
jgi:hypothetical protein